LNIIILLFTETALKKVLPFKGKSNIFLFLIIVLGLCLRLYNITYRGIWLDEGISIKWAGMDILSMVINTAIDVHPPLYYLILHYWMLLFGSSEFAVRMLSTTAGVLTIAAAYKLAKYLFDEKTALISAFLVSISALHIRYAQETRGYTIVALLSVLSIYYFLKLIYSEEKISYPYLFSSIALVYTHSYGLIIIFTEAVIYYLYYFIKIPFANCPKNVNRNIFKVAISYIPWVPVMIFQLFKVQTGFAFWIKKPDAKILLMTFLQHSGSMFNKFTFITLIIFAVLTLLAVTGSLRDKTRSQRENSVMFLFFCFLFPIILLFIVSQKASSVYDIKSTIAFSVPFYIVISYGISSMLNKSIRALTILIIAVLSAASLNTLYYSIRETKEEWREACNYLESKYRPNEVIIVDPGYYRRFTFDYYFKEPAAKVITHEKLNMQSREIRETANFESTNKFWLIMSTDDNYRVYNYISALKPVITDSARFKGVAVYAFKKGKE
jgi:uncharacterized membrane protein